MNVRNKIKISFAELFGVNSEFVLFNNFRLKQLSRISERLFRDIAFYRREEFTNRTISKRVLADIDFLFSKIQKEGIFTKNEIDFLRYGLSSFFNQYLGYNSPLISSVGHIEKANIPWMRLFATKCVEEISREDFRALSADVITYMFSSECSERYYFSDKEAQFFKTVMRVILSAYRSYLSEQKGAKK